MLGWRKVKLLQGSRLWGQATKCMWWMPWRSQAMKDVAACEKLRGAGKRALIRRCPNGETHPSIDGFRARDLENAKEPCASVTSAKASFVSSEHGEIVKSLARV